MKGENKEKLKEKTRVQIIANCTFLKVQQEGFKALLSDFLVQNSWDSGQLPTPCSNIQSSVSVPSPFLLFWVPSFHLLLGNTFSLQVSNY